MTLTEIKKTLEKLGVLGPVQWLYENVPGVKQMVRSYFLKYKIPEFKPCTPASMDVLETLYDRYFDNWKTLSGDYLEFGVYAGYSLWYSQKLANDRGLDDMRFFGFDSFEGLPEPQGVDTEGKFTEGDYRASRETVERYLNEHGVDWDRTELIEGYYDEVLNDNLKAELQLTGARLIFVDCDLYQSTVPVLHFCKDLMQEGTVIAFDDWTVFGDKEELGEQRAWNEFTDRNPEMSFEELSFPEWHGAAFEITDLPNS